MRGGKLNHIYSSNNCTRNYQNWTTIVKDIVEGCVVYCFATQCIRNVHHEPVSFAACSSSVACCCRYCSNLLCKFVYALNQTAWYCLFLPLSGVYFWIRERCLCFSTLIIQYYIVWFARAHRCDTWHRFVNEGISFTLGPGAFRQCP